MCLTLFKNSRWENVNMRLRSMFFYGRLFKTDWMYFKRSNNGLFDMLSILYYGKMTGYCYFKIIYCSTITQFLHCLLMYNWQSDYFLTIYDGKTTTDIFFKAKVTQLRYRNISWCPNRDTTNVSFASLRLSPLILSGTSDSPGVRHFSSLASSHTHIRASSISLSCALSHSLVHLRGVLSCFLWDLWMQGWLVIVGWLSSQEVHV